MAASTNSTFRRVSTEERTILANRATWEIASATTSFQTPLPMAVMMAMASREEGTAIRMSTIRIRKVSTLPPKKPAAPPISAPTTKAMPMMAKEHSREILPPYRTRANRSRPNSSVPKMYSGLGLVNRSEMCSLVTFS